MCDFLDFLYRNHFTLNVASKKILASKNNCSHRHVNKIKSIIIIMIRVYKETVGLFTQP